MATHVVFGFHKSRGFSSVPSSDPEMPLWRPAKREASHSHSAIPFSAKQAIIATATVGGVIVLLLLLWAVLDRRRRLRSPARSYKGLDPKIPTIKSRKQPQQPSILPLHIQDAQLCKSSDMSERMPMRQMTQTLASVPTSVGLPRHISKAARTPFSPSIAAHQRLPSSSTPLQTRSQLDNQPNEDSTLPQLNESHQNLSPGIAAHTSTPGENSQATQHPSTEDTLAVDDEKAPERWSWTNSEAPPTPRLYAPTVRGSGADFVRFKRKTASSDEMRAYAEQKSRVKEIEPALPARKPSLRRLLLKDTSRRSPLHQQHQ